MQMSWLSSNFFIAKRTSTQKEWSGMNSCKFHDGHMTAGVQNAPPLDYFAQELRPVLSVVTLYNPLLVRMCGEYLEGFSCIFFMHFVGICAGLVDGMHVVEAWMVLFCYKSRSFLVRARQHQPRLRYTCTTGLLTASVSGKFQMHISDTLLSTISVGWMP